MKFTVIVGVLLIIAGVAGLTWKGFSYSTEEEVAKLGPLQVTAQKEKQVPVPTWASYSAIGVGIVLVLVGAARR